MAKTQETYNKKEKEKQRKKKREDKLAKKEERRANSDGGGFESMIAYVDENGMISDTPPDPSKKQKVNASNIEIGIPKKEEPTGPVIHQGKIDFFNEQKGFGFIRDLQTQEKYFVHINSANFQPQENDKVSFEVERGPKGMNAVRVKKA